jgi:5-methylcytosine-specific restriction endonuclease McrA
MAKILFTCSYCNKEELLERKIADRRKFCSIKCSSLSQVRREVVKCDTCKAELERKLSDIKRNNFCNKKCFDLFKLGKSFKLKENIQFDCLECGNKVSVLPSRYYRSGKERKFCSKQCSSKYHLRDFKSSAIELECNNCRAKIYRTKSHIKSRNYCSYECMGEYYSKEGLFSGENSPTWGGGKKSYYGPNWLESRRQCRAREDYICKDCGITEEDYGQELSVHHIIPFVMFNDDYEKANDLRNLVAICEPCHRLRHSGENHHTKFSQTYNDLLG